MRQKELLLIAITIFMTAIAVIIGDLIHTVKTPKFEAIRPSVAKPIDINIDLNVFKILEEKTE